MKIIIGQEAICPDGLGRVEDCNLTMPHNWIQVKTYIENRSCKWAQHNVQLIDPVTHTIHQGKEYAN